MLLLTLVLSGSASAQYTYRWQTDTTPEGTDRASLIQPVHGGLLCDIVRLDEPVRIVPHSASLRLMQKYSVLLGTEWTAGQAYRLLQMPGFWRRPKNAGPKSGSRLQHVRRCWRR